MTQLSEALLSGDIETFERLLPDSNPDEYSTEGVTPLHLATLLDKEKAVTLLIKAKCDLELPQKQNSGPSPKISFGLRVEIYGRTALDIACQAGRPRIAEILIAAGASFESRRSDKRTPLHLSSSAGLEGVVLSLLNRGADPEAKALGGWTPLHVAAFSGSVPVAKALIAGGSHHSPVALQGLTPLHIAAIGNKIDLISYLTSLGAGINHKSTKGRTPLHKAIQEGSDMATIAHLVSKGADVKAEDDDGCNSLHFQAVDNDELTSFLLECGAEPSKASHKGETALDRAESMKFTKVERVLKNADGSRGHVDQLQARTLAEMLSNVPQSILDDVEVMAEIERGESPPSSSSPALTESRGATPMPESPAPKDPKISRVSSRGSGSPARPSSVKQAW